MEFGFYLSVTSRCSAETAKGRITLATPPDSLGTLVFWRGAEDIGKTQTGSPLAEALNAGG